jgi:hypothetical protein
MRYALIYGGIAGLIIIGLTWIILLSGWLGHLESVIMGYLIMVAGLTMIFVGVKRYRDVEMGGVIRFGRALILAVGIALVASLIYVLGAELYFATPSGWQMVEMIDQTMMPGYRNPIYRMYFTFLEILPADVVVALVSAAVLRNPRVLPARAT